jgi:O-antigen/teichoic acid export membrane protein
VTLRELGPGTIAVLAGNAVGVLASFGIRWLMARALTPAEVGIAILTIAVAATAAGFSTLGLQTASAHWIARARAIDGEDRARAGARQALTVAAISGSVAAFVVAGGAGGLSRLFDEPPLTGPLRIIAPSILAIAVAATLAGVARAFDDLRGRVLVRDAIGGALRLLGVALAAAFAPTAPVVVLGYTAGTVATELSFLAFGIRRGWLRRPATPVARPDLARTLPPVALLAWLFHAAQWFDLLLLGLFAPVAVVGVYSIARGVARMLDLANDAASQQFLSAASGAYARGGADALRPVFLHTRTLVACLLLPLVAVLVAEPAFLLGWVFGPDYAAGGPALRLFALAIGVASCLGYGDKALVALGRPGAATISAVVGLGAGLAVLIATAPRHGALGAAQGWAAFLVVQSALNSFLLWRARGVHPLTGDLADLLLLILAPAGAVAMALHAFAIGPIPTVLAVGAIAALGAAWVLHRLDRPARVG